MRIEELKEFARENFGVDVAHQVIRSAPAPGETVLVTFRHTDQAPRMICCPAHLVTKNLKRIR